MEMGEEGIIYLSLQCHHQNDLPLGQTGSREAGRHSLFMTGIASSLPPWRCKTARCTVGYSGQSLVDVQRTVPADLRFETVRVRGVGPT